MPRERFYHSLLAVTATVTALALLAVVVTLAAPVIEVRLPAQITRYIPYITGCGRYETITLLNETAPPLDSIVVEAGGVGVTIKAWSSDRVVVQLVNEGRCIEWGASISGGQLRVHVEGQGCCKAYINIPRRSYKQIDVKGSAVKLAMEGVDAGEAWISLSAASAEIASARIKSLHIDLDAANLHTRGLTVTKEAVIKAVASNAKISLANHAANILLKPPITAANIQTACREAPSPVIMISGSAANIVVTCS
ncbi:MAG: hypothetical protein GXO09_03690 [Crenarchaeota archaeon]|nr:hypothetical protein [Thermoproteota archaeon]